MKGYVAKKRNRYYAVVYEGLDPITGKEIRAWHGAGTNKAEATKLANRLAAEIQGRDDDTRSLTFGAYLTTQWLPGKKITLAESTWHGYRRKIERHILPALGPVPIRRLKVTQLEALYNAMLHPTDPAVKALAPKTALEIHLIIRGSLGDAVRRGMLKRNVATVAHAPRLRSIPKHEAQAWTAAQLQAFLHAAAGHRCFAALWVAACTGVRGSELLGLRWGDIDLDAATLSINRGLVAIGYELHESRGKTANSRRCINLGPTTVDVLTGWQSAEQRAARTDPTGYAFTAADGGPIHPHSISQTFERIARRAGLPIIRFHDVRHTHATLAIKDHVPVKVVSERLGHATPAFTIDTYQHVLPGMQAETACSFEALIGCSTGSAR